MLGVEFSEHGGYTSARYRLMASSAERPPQSMIVGLAVRKSLVLKEGPVIERLRALLAHEAVGVPLRVEGRDVVLCDGVAAASTLGGEVLEVAVLAVSFLVLLVETGITELIAAVGTKKMFGVPGSAQSCDHLANYGLAAGRADSLLSSFNALLVHILL